MNKKLCLISTFLLLFSITVTFGQNSPPDIRRSAEEQKAFEKSVPLNPAKISPPVQVDSRMVQPQVGPTNWKPGVAPVDERKTPELNLVDNKVNGQAGHVADRTQPAGAQSPGKTINYRDIHGNKTQPEAARQATPSNYRNLNGVKTQPEGLNPGR
ncbi:MAG: hypothetical protein NT040_03745 [Bacteroidetes bacterium]|nr:hypothetical protein [Bacteroidota bacterium]